MNKNLIKETAEQVTNITPSVIALAVATGMTPEKFATSLVNTDGTDSFLAELTSAMIVLAQKKAKAEAKKTV
jgi:hypothetical protein